MSEVQKFKENRKILKAQGGVKTSTPREEIIGDWIREENRSLFGSGMRWYNRNSPVGRQAIAMKTETRVKGADGREWILKPDGTKILASLRGHKPATTSSASVAFSPVLPEFRDEYKNKEETVQQSTTDTTTTKTGRTGRISKPTVKVTPKGQAYWDKQYQDFKSKMTDDQKAWLDQKGIDYSSAEQLQGYLSRINKNIGKFGVDNKWGGDSQKAWEDFVNTTMKNNPLQTPVEEPLVDAPDPFGYKTSNTYEDNDFASKLKRMGIRSNADLMHFMYESKKPNWKGDAWTTQFRNDVDRLLGGDYSDANIRRVFKTKNGWNNGFMGRGDFGDFQNVLQTNAGVWNGIYDAKQNEARMNAARQQYAAKLSQQFAPQLLKPTVEDPSNKFMVGNIGATTLGNLPSTKPQSINLSQESNKQENLGNLDWIPYAQQTGYFSTS